MTIELMNANHVAAIAELETLCFSDPWPEAAIVPELTNPLSLWLVAMDGDRLAGYIGSQTVMEETDMMNVAVHPDYRRQGIGEQLILSLVEKLKARGSRILRLEVRASNEAAQKLYEKLGFRQLGRRKNYYRHPKEDGLILGKEWEV